MSRLPLWRLSVLTTPEAEEAVSELLTSTTGATASSYTDFDTRACHISVYLEHRRRYSRENLANLKQRLMELRELSPQTGALRISIRRLPPRAWRESWKRHFPVIQIGSRLMVKPSWSRRHAAPNQSVVVLDPGLSFGTGQHPTTAFCLLHLVRFRQPRSPQSLLDIGTGSGILAISAAKLGYAPVDAFDIDPESLRVCRLNARGNRVNHRIHFSLKNLASFTPQSQKYYSVICANLVSDLLIEHRARIAGRLEPDGILLLAGILAKEFAAVQRAYEQSGLWLVRSRLQREWRSGVFRWRAQAPRQR